MPEYLMHDLDIAKTRDEASRQRFAMGLRGYVLNDMAGGMRQRYETKIKPAFEKKTGHAALDGNDVLAAMKPEAYFRFYSSLRYNAQEMVWRSVIPQVERNLETLKAKAKALDHDQAAVGGSLKLNPGLKIPKNVSEVDVHLAPGGYTAEWVEDDLSAGAIYDNGLNVFSFGLMGKNLDDIGWSMAQYIKTKFPDFKPTRILDAGCTIGHNSVAWAQTFPAAEVHAIDVAAPLLRYGHARALSLGVPVHFAQMNAEALDFPDQSFDVVFSSMFLHELSLKQITSFMTEAHRVLRPGGLLLNMELPPNNQMQPYDSFYLDWDHYYNNEPYYKGFRDQDYRGLCAKAGFAPDRYLQFVTPQFTYMTEADYRAAVRAENQIGSETGRLADGVQWFGFGAWK